jgi:4-alpha-glucanotransferase
MGDLGPGAYRFADFLADSHQGWWQMLPVSPTGFGNSPYMSPSAFAGNELSISLERLADDGLLHLQDAEPPKDATPERVNYQAAARFKHAMLRQAFQEFRKRAASDPEFQEFRGQAASWLPDFALFGALRDAHGGAPWTGWDPDVRSRKPQALSAARERLADEVLYQEFLQYEFHRQWVALREYCHQRGVGLIGDIPIFVAHDSVDVWAHPDIFAVDSLGHLTVMAGVPPDYFARDGQLWGNPLYRWDVLRERGYDWWIDRFRTTFDRFDAVRLDHFIGFQRYWEVPADARTARNGRYSPGPGAHFFESVFKTLGPLELIAEDLGNVTPEVVALRNRFDFPGMRVLQFAFADGSSCIHLPHTFPRRCAAYTGTHDNDTTAGWFHDRGSPTSTRSPEEIRREHEFVLRYAGTDGREIQWDLIRLALMSVADTAVFPLQDVLGLGSEARMNTPGTSQGNWEWRCPQAALSGEVACRLALLTDTYSRTAEAQRQTA